ncbi:MAG: hypothetical protein AVDCRST_MAG88-29 [uncultured Thermomicrobiales bacterium]|uniref:Uncharacterized protein n=1 Tax=uncultured Thermomicrobiales bacterium TaxID=1645740 RepID=A0A6J4U8A5_9BACT|nr:MAG: hypothetical protein AVDCRST_MAG88-29 [uncultured Thermomicrobiales bacterium]
MVGDGGAGARSVQTLFCVLPARGRQSEEPEGARGPAALRASRASEGRPPPRRHLPQRTRQAHHFHPRGGSADACQAALKMPYEGPPFSRRGTLGPPLAPSPAPLVVCMLGRRSAADTG